MCQLEQPRSTSLARGDVKLKHIMPMRHQGPAPTPREIIHNKILLLMLSGRSFTKERNEIGGIVQVVVVACSRFFDTG